MRARGNVVQLRPSVGRSCPDPTCGAPMTRETRDGDVVLVGGVSSIPLPPPSFGERMSRAAVAAAFILLAWMVREAIRENAAPPVPACVGACADDSPRSEEP